MTRAEKERDEFGKKALAPLRSAPLLDSEDQAVEREKFLLHGENLRKNMVPGISSIQSKQPKHAFTVRIGKINFPIYKALAIVLLVLVFITASSITVYAEQRSLPGEPLYTIKSASEDIRLAMTVSPQARLDLTLDFTNRRLGEIQGLLSKGKPLPDQASNRYQNELDEALQLAAQLNDQQLETALNEIKIHAGGQGMTIQELIASLPDQAYPAIIHLQQRLQEQVQLSTFGEDNPQGFRKEMQERAQNRHGPKKSDTSDEPGGTPILTTASPVTTQGQDGKEGGKLEPTNGQGNGNGGNGQGQPGQGNGNHGPNPTHTPRP